MSFVDPLWEFVLEDYEEEDNGWGRRRSNRKKKEAARNEGSYFNFFGGDSDQKKSRKAYQSDDRNDADVSGRRELSKVNLTRNDSRGSASSWGRKSKISSSKSSKKYSNDGKDGFWDVITGAPPAATIQKNNARKSSPNKNSKNRVLRKKNASESIKRSQSNVLGNSQPKPLVRTSSTKSEKSKSGFKKRFRRNQSTKSSEKNRVSKPEVKQTIPNKPPQSAKLPDDDGFYPIDFFHHIADSLDPWIVDSSVASSSEESSITIDDDEDTRSYTSSQVQNEDGVVAKSESRSSVRARDEKSNYKLESLLDQPLPDSKSAKPKGNTHHQKQSTKEETGVTEIRLRVNPGGNTLSEQVIKANPNLYYSFPEDAQKFLHKDDVSSKSRPSFDASESDNSSVVSRIKQHLKIKPKQPRVVKDRDSRKIAKDSIRPTSKEMKPPTAVHIQKKPEARDDWEDIEHQKKCQLWKRGSCNSERTCKNDSTNLFGKADETEVFPTSRVVVNGQIHSVMGPGSDPFNGVTSVSPNRLTNSEGPQSVFAYDYDSNENMDVSYKKPNQKPRDSIAVRNLGAPPALSLVGENVVIQVEASTVSETDCIIRQGLWWRTQPSFPNTPGVDVVGKVYSINPSVGKKYGLSPMQSVVSLVRWGGNRRFVTIHPNQLVKVPRGLDPAHVACLPETYLAAFQVLHMGQPVNLRYGKHSLKGKSVLILGCMTNNMGKAMIELALNAGVANIYATSKKKHWKTLISYGVMPLSSDPMEYIHRITGTIDLVLAPNGNLREDVTPVHFRALIPRFGRLIISGRRINGNDIPINDWRKAQNAPALACGKNKALQKILGNSATYDVYDEWEKNIDLCKRDLYHLFKLLDTKVIKPEVLDRISLNKVAKAHELIETKRLPGFLVCEPWMKTKKRAVYL